MRVVVFGGAGDMGSRAVEDLAASPGVERVTIADRNVGRARELAAALQSESGAQIDVATVDANIKDSLVATMRGHDVAASALGPFHRFETKLVSAALEADIDYASVCNEWEPAQKVFDKFEQQAIERGRVILTGLGACPGATNIAFAHLAAPLDSVERVRIACYQPFSASGGQAVLQHLLHIMSGKALAWRNGRRTRPNALSISSVVEFPRFGNMRAWNVGHAEPATIPRFYPGIREVSFVMGFGTTASLLLTPARWGLFASPERTDAAVTAITWVEGWWRRKPSPGALRVDVAGRRGGRAVESMLCCVAPMRDLAGCALSIGAQMIARGELTRRGGGIFAPEAAIPTGAAIRAFAERGLCLYEDLAMTQPLAVAG